MGKVNEFHIHLITLHCISTCNSMNLAKTMLEWGTRY